MFMFSSMVRILFGSLFSVVNVITNQTRLPVLRSTYGVWQTAILKHAALPTFP